MTVDWDLGCRLGRIWSVGRDKEALYIEGLVWVTTEKKKSNWTSKLLGSPNSIYPHMNLLSHIKPVSHQTCSLSTNPESTILLIWKLGVILVIMILFLLPSHLLFYHPGQLIWRNRHTFFFLAWIYNMPMCSLQPHILPSRFIQNYLELLVSYILYIWGLCSWFSLAFRFQLKHYHLWECSSLLSQVHHSSQYILGAFLITSKSSQLCSEYLQVLFVFTFLG